MKPPSTKQSDRSDIGDSSQKRQIWQRSWQRWLLLAVGGLALVLGAVGIVLPLLPTTPFVLLALWCFSRASARWHNWLLNHAHFGPFLANWHQYRGMTLSHKRRACALVILSFGFSIYTVSVLWLKILLLVMGTTVFLHLWQMNTVPCPGDLTPDE